MIIQDWVGLLIASFQQVWIQFVGLIPQLLLAVVFFIVGLIVASVLGTVVEKLIEALKIDKALSSAGMEKYVERAGLKLNVGKFFGQIIYWFIIIISLVIVSEILGISTLTSFLGEVVVYIPRVIVAIITMAISFIGANFLRKGVRASVMTARLHAADFLGSLAWWSVMIVGATSTLNQLKLYIPVLDTLITGVIAMFAIAGGIAFGLGGKEYASHLIEKFRGQVERK